MIWVWVVVTVLVVGAVAVVVAGREDGMAEVYDDRPDVPFPVGRPLTPSDLDHLRFSTGFRGYRMDEVDAFVARVTADLLAREQAELDTEPVGEDRREQALEPTPTAHSDGGTLQDDHAPTAAPAAPAEKTPDTESDVDESRGEPREGSRPSRPHTDDEARRA